MLSNAADLLPAGIRKNMAVASERQAPALGMVDKSPNFAPKFFKA